MSSITTDGLATLDGKIDASLKKLLPTAWVNFDGTDGSIRDSYNVSVARTEIGVYAITFTEPMDNTNYVVSSFCNDADGSGGNFNHTIPTASMTVTGFELRSMTSTGNALTDLPLNMVQLFGGLD